jgi:hypothetical protein
MKVTWLFVIILGVMILGMPFLKMMKGDGTLAGQIRTFLSYTTSLTSLLGSLMTLLLVIAVVTSDIRNKQIFGVATKPIARWGYIIGRWLGVVWIDAILVVGCGSAIYCLAQYLRAGEALHGDDRRAVESEVFTARQRIAPEPINTTAGVDKRIRVLKQQGDFERTLEGYTARAGGDKLRAMDLIVADIAKEIEGAIQSIPPRGSRVWEFSGIDVAGRETRSSGSVLGIDPRQWMAHIETDPLLLGKLVYKGPIRVNDAEGQVMRIDSNSFVVRFFPVETLPQRFESMAVGKVVEIVADPTIQITYKAIPLKTLTEGILSSLWELRNDKDNIYYREMREDPVETKSTLTVSARVVDGDGRTQVRYVNLSEQSSGFPTSVTILDADMGIMFPVGRFEWNFVKAMALIFIQLVFLAALGVMAGSFVSFPVASLFCFAILAFQLSRSFIIDAITPLTRSEGAVGVFGHFNQYVVKALEILLPDFTRTSPADSLVDGVNISWEFLSETAFSAICVQSLLLLLIACLLFRRRELARVQV